MPPVLKRVGPLMMTAKSERMRKYPGVDDRLARQGKAELGKRKIECPVESTTATGLGPGIGNVRQILNNDGVTMRMNRSVEMAFHERTGRVKKFDMDVVTAHASRETPVSFPGWRGYPPSFDSIGKRIDYSLQMNGGAFAQRQITSSTFPYVGRSTPHIAGNTTQQVKTRSREYQSQLRHMKTSDLAAHAAYVVSRTGPQHTAFGFCR